MINLWYHFYMFPSPCPEATSAQFEAEKSFVVTLRGVQSCVKQWTTEMAQFMSSFSVLWTCNCIVPWRIYCHCTFAHCKLSVFLVRCPISCIHTVDAKAIFYEVRWYIGMLSGVIGVITPFWLHSLFPLMWFFNTKAYICQNWVKLREWCPY